MAMSLWPHFFGYSVRHSEQHHTKHNWTTNRPHNRQLPGRISRITDCNFTVRMLYRNKYWLFIYFTPALCFILMYNCGLTVRNKRICYVMLCWQQTRAGDTTRAYRGEQDVRVTAAHCRRERCAVTTTLDNVSAASACCRHTASAILRCPACTHISRITMTPIAQTSIGSYPTLSEFTFHRRFAGVKYQQWYCLCDTINFHDWKRVFDFISSNDAEQFPCCMLVSKRISHYTRQIMT